MSSGTIRLTVSTGTAKPIPARDRHELLVRGAYVEHGQVLVPGEADDPGVVGLVAEGDLGRATLDDALDDVEVRDHVAAVVPDEAGARARRHLENVAGPEVDGLDLR